MNVQFRINHVQLSYMHWQDLALSIGQIIFVIALLPSILSQDKPALITSVVNSVVLYTFALIDVTIPLYLTGVTVAATALGWTVLAYQKYAMGRRVRR